MKIEKGKFIRVIIITVCMTVAVVGILFSVFCKVTGRSLIKGEDYTFVKKIMSKYGKLYAIQEKTIRGTRLAVQGTYIVAGYSPMPVQAWGSPIVSVVSTPP